MIKSYSALEVKRGDRIYTLQLSSDSPLGEIHDVLHEMKMYTIKLMNERVAQEVVQDPPPEEEANDGIPEKSS